MSSSSGLVDFHCHLDLYPDLERAVQDAESSEVFTLAVTTTPKAWGLNNALARKTKYVRAALGLHPQLVAEREGELSEWDSLFSETRYIGEVGLDAGVRFYKSLEAQKRIFNHVLSRCAKAGDKIITVHSVRAVKAVLDSIETHLPKSRGKIVLHWFTGTKSEARRALDLGCYFSINTTMLESTRHTSMIASIPLGKLLTETDGPFTKTEGRVSKPSDVRAAVDALGLMHGLSGDEIAKVVRNNLRTLLESE